MLNNIYSIRQKRRQWKRYICMFVFFSNNLYINFSITNEYENVNVNLSFLKNQKQNRFSRKTIKKASVFKRTFYSIEGVLVKRLSFKTRERIKKILVLFTSCILTMKVIALSMKGNNRALFLNEKKYFTLLLSTHTVVDNNIGKIANDLRVIYNAYRQPVSYQESIESFFGDENVDLFFREFPNDAIRKVKIFGQEIEIPKPPESKIKDTERKIESALSLYEQAFNQISKRYCKLKKCSRGNIEVKIHSEVDDSTVSFEIYTPEKIKEEINNKNILQFFNNNVHSFAMFCKIVDIYYHGNYGIINAQKTLTEYFPDALFYLKSNKYTTNDLEKINDVINKKSKDSWISYKWLSKLRLIFVPWAVS